MDDDESTHFPFHLVPEGVPVVCDMSSDIGSRKVDWSKYGMVYAGAQKNLGTSGCTVAIIRDDLIGKFKKAWAGKSWSDTDFRLLLETKM